MTIDPLQQKENELELVLALDAVRDSFDDDEDPAAMFDSILNFLQERFQAQAGGILLLSEQHNEIDYIGCVGVPALTAEALCRQALNFPDWTSLPDSPTPHGIGTCIRLKGQTLGGMFIARQQNPFTADELALLRLAEHQIDSAVIQARTVWKHMQRNRELQAIYEIDRLRDYTASEGDMIGGFTSALLKHFDAELCIVSLRDSETSDLVIRGVVDKLDLSADVLDNVHQAARKLTRAETIPSPAALSLHLLGAPLDVANVRLGVVVIGRQSLPFKAVDLRLLQAMTSQMDSALAYSRTHQQLRQRTHELEVIYRIDQIRDQEKDFDQMLQQVLTELCRAISGEMGYVMLYNEKEEARLELKSATTENLLTNPDILDIIRHYSREALNRGHLVHAHLTEKALRSIVAVPLVLNEQIIGVFGAVNSTSARGFNSEDRRLLTAITSQVDTAIFERLEQRRMRNLLGRSVDPKVLDYLLRSADTADLLTGERVVLSVLFADLRGSTEWAERTSPEELVNTLNMFLGKMTDVIFKHGGTLDKFVGDEVIALFGSPLSMADHAQRAARAALDMQAAHRAMQAELRAAGKELPHLGIGISSGEVIAGEIGPPNRTDFTAIGHVVNLGSRLCSSAAPGQIIISHNTRSLLPPDTDCTELEPVTLKGIREAVRNYELHIMKEA